MSSLPWTFQDTDFSNSGVWTHVSSPVFADGQFAAGTAFKGETSNPSRIEHSNFISDPAGSVSFACWVNLTDETPAAETLFFIQRLVDGVEITHGVGNTIQMIAFKELAFSHRRTSRINGTLLVGLGWKRFGIRIENLSGNAANVDMFIDGVEATYLVHNQLNGDGFTGFTNTANSILGSGSKTIEGLMDRFYIADDIAFTDAQFKQDYDEEMAILTPSNIKKIYPVTVIDDKIVGNLIMKNIYKQ